VSEHSSQLHCIPSKDRYKHSTTRRPPAKALPFQSVQDMPKYLHRFHKLLSLTIAVPYSITLSIASLWRSLLVWLVTTIVILLAGSRASLAESSPNILLIISDDQRFDDLDNEVMPQVSQRIFERGVTFSRGYVTTPVCCPSRASILTGQYASRHGIQGNEQYTPINSIVPLLLARGYRTGHFGKFLNSWSGEQRPEYVGWLSTAGGRTPYTDPPLNINGVWQTVPGYLTNLVSQHAQAFIRDAVGADHPFFVTMAALAPHFPATPHPDTLKLFRNRSLPKPRSFNEPDRADKPSWIRRMHRFRVEETARLTGLYRDRLRTLWTLDQEVGKVLDTIAELGISNNTVVIFISDNGYLFGEHTLVEKGAAYEEAVHVPFGVFDPRATINGQVRRELVANIDIAPTILELTGTADTSTRDGKSLLPLLRGNGYSARSQLLLEGWGESHQGRRRRPVWTAVHTGDTVLISNEKDRGELYDLTRDPLQIRNVFDTPEYRAVRTSLERSRTEILASVGVFRK